MTPTASVILPTYNRGDVIHEAIESVRAQKFEDWELIVVDDGSTDETAAIVGSYLHDPRISYVNKKNSGSAHTRNIGVGHSVGPYVTFLDSDDVADPDWLSELLRIIEMGFSVACCSVRHVTPSRERIIEPEDMGPAFHNFVMKFTNGGSYMLTREIFDAVGRFDVRAPAEHTELGIRVADHCARRGVQIESVFRPLITVRHTRDDHMRRNDESVYLGARHFIEKHRDKLVLDRRLYHNYVSVVLYRGRGKPLRDVAPFYTTLIRLRPLYWRTYARVARSVIWSFLAR